MIGDPSGKSQERVLLSAAQIDATSMESVRSSSGSWTSGPPTTPRAL